MDSKNEQHLNGDPLRSKMVNYWKMYNPSLESMMLSHDAKYLAENEQNEIISYLPCYKGKRVLELGAGIGRFTSRLAKTAGHVTAIDFMQEYVEHNKKHNGHHENVIFKCADVTKLDFPPGSFDFVFSNWLFMYLGDDETKAVFGKILEWLTPEGYFFLRESCYHQSGNVKREENPTIYRTPIDYCFALENTIAKDKAAFKIIRGKNILSYIKYNYNPNQLCFLAKRTELDNTNKLRQALQNYYCLDNIIMGARLYGYMWYSTGGEAANRDLCSRLTLKLNQRVLDVGCGTGASAFFMARQYGVQVHGIDISAPMIHAAIENQGKQEATVRKRVQFEINDILSIDNDSEMYDVIYSREVILHIQDKKKLFQKLYKWLKPGGTLFITDYCKGPTPDSEEFLAHTSYKNWHLRRIESYSDELRSVGLQDVQSEDMRDQLLRILQRELDSHISGRECFIHDFSKDNFDSFANSWIEKIKFVKDAQLTWGLFSARK